MIDRIKGWFTETRASDTDYTAVALAAIQAAAHGFDGVRATGSYVSALNIIENSAAIAELSGEFSESLRPHLGSIARSLVDRGEATYELQVTATGELMLLPATIATVAGSADPASWAYSLNRAEPSGTVVVNQPAAGVLAFRAHVDPKRPWRGRPALEASNTTGALLSQLEKQLTREASVLPTRILTAGSVGRQASEIEQSIRRGGIVSVLQAGATASITDPSGLRAGVLRNETSAPVASVYAQLERAVCAACGVPPGLILSGGDGAAAREDFRRFAAATISPLLQSIAAEWRAKVAPLEFNLDALRASDETARARAVGSRAGAVSKLVASGVSLDEALLLAGVD